MQFGLQINPYFPGATGNPWPAVEQVSRALDASNFDSLWVYDHFLYEGGYAGGHPYTEPVMEAFTVLGAIAAITRRVRLGQLVLGVPYRNPAMMAKMATTLDMISNGRTILGIGAGWHKREYEGYGWGTFEEVPVRMKRLEEAIKVVLALWREEERPATFDGSFYRLDKVMENPYPIQKPHPPLMIGGSGEKVTLRLVAQYAQFCNVSGDVETVTHRLGILKEHCQRLGRPYEAITKSIYTTLLIGKDEADVAAKLDRWSAYVPRNGIHAGTAEQLIAIFRAYADAGVDYAIFRTPEWTEVEPAMQFSEKVIPGLR